MIYDHWMHKADTAFIRQFLPGIETVVDWFQCHISENALPGKFNDWWFFADWADQFESGIPKGAYSGYSSVISLHFAYTLEHAAAIMAVCGKRETSEWYAQLASTIKQAVMKHCYHKQKGLIAQTPEKTQFSQHSNIMGF